MESLLPVCHHCTAVGSSSCSYLQFAGFPPPRTHLNILSKRQQHPGLSPLRHWQSSSQSPHPQLLTPQSFPVIPFYGLSLLPAVASVIPRCLLFAVLFLFVQYLINNCSVMLSVKMTDVWLLSLTRPRPIDQGLKTTRLYKDSNHPR